MHCIAGGSASRPWQVAGGRVKRFDLWPASLSFANLDTRKDETKTNAARWHIMIHGDAQIPEGEVCGLEIGFFGLTRPRCIVAQFLDDGVALAVWILSPLQWTLHLAVVALFLYLQRILPQLQVVSTVYKSSIEGKGEKRIASGAWKKRRANRMSLKHSLT